MTTHIIAVGRRYWREHMPPTRHPAQATALDPDSAQAAIKEHNLQGATIVNQQDEIDAWERSYYETHTLAGGEI